MRSKLLIGGLLATVLFVPALAQTNPPTSNPPAPAATPAPATRADTAPASTVSHGDMWRASKLIGVNVYNDQNEKLGDINEIILDKSGKVAGLVIGVGGFLGMGRHDVIVEMSKLKFVDEPVRTSSTTTGTSRPAGTTGATSTTASSSSSSSSKKWYPDHAVWSGVTKDQLKGMTEFKYD
jgi:sporulation protein YlmC with PRC-barrel domain